MADARDSLPPLVRLILDEEVDTFRNLGEVKKFVRERRREYRNQSEWTREKYAYPARESAQGIGAFVAVPSAGLDLFSGEGACQAYECRLGYVQPFAQSLGLYADTIYLSDPFTEFFMGERFSEWDLTLLAGHISTLKLLTPLVDAGIVRFRPARGTYCEGCFEKVYEGANAIAEELRLSYSDNFEVIREKDSAAVRCHGLYGEEDVYTTVARITKKQPVLPEDGELVRRYLLRDIADALTASANAREHSGTVISNSRVAVAALLQAEGRRPRVGSLEQWENLRSATLPWVENLSIQQVLHLRVEADKALPRLRERLAQALRPLSTDDAAKASDRLEDCVAELRAEAAEVAAELDTLKRTGGRSFSEMVGTLGLTISGYGYFSDAVGAAPTLTGLVTLLGLVHQTGRHRREAVEELRSRPGYVLLKAQDILRHASTRQ